MPRHKQTREDYLASVKRDPADRRRREAIRRREKKPPPKPTPRRDALREAFKHGVGPRADA